MTRTRGREILFCSDFPLGCHNREPEEKMARFARRGYDVHYVEKLGVRNPGVRHLAEIRGRLRARVGDRPDAPFDTAYPKLLVPRRAPGIDALNRRWLARQLLGLLDDPSESILWLRYPTPELVSVVDAANARLVIYEAVDDHTGSPQLPERLRRVVGDTERRLLERADLVFAWSEPIAEALAAAHPNVVIASAAADLDRFAPIAAAPAPAGGAPVALWTGALDFRFDAELLAEVARRLPGWTLRLVGPLASRSSATALARLANIEVLGPAPSEAMPEFLAGATVCVMPYRQNPFADMLFPVKLAEYLAAGRPVVSTPIRAARELSDVVSIADGPDEFARAVEQSAADDSPAARAQRLERARGYSWDARIDQMDAAIQRALRDGG